MLEGILGERSAADLVAVDRPAGDDWAEYLKVSIDSGFSRSAIVIAVPGVANASEIAGVLAGREGQGGRHLLLPRGLSDILAYRDPKFYERVLTAAAGARGDLADFARQLQAGRRPLEDAWSHYANSGGLPSSFSIDPEISGDQTWAASTALTTTTSSDAAQLGLLLAEVKQARAAPLSRLAHASGRSHGWARSVDTRAEENLVWLRIPHAGTSRGSVRRVLVDPAYAETAFADYKPSEWETLVRSMWRMQCRDNVDSVRRHGISWASSNHEIVLTNLWALEVTGRDREKDQRRLRPLRHFAETGRHALQVTAHDLGLNSYPVAIPAATMAIAGEVGVLSWTRERAQKKARSEPNYGSR